MILMLYLFLFLFFLFPIVTNGNISTQTLLQVSESFYF